MWKYIYLLSGIHVYAYISMFSYYAGQSSGSLICLYIYASPSSGDAYWDRQLTPNFELIFFVCRQFSIIYYDSEILSVHSFVCMSSKTAAACQYLANYILCVFITIFPLLSRNFLASQAATYVVCRLLIACQQN